MFLWKGVLKNMQQICRRTLMLKYAFNWVAWQYAQGVAGSSWWNHCINILKHNYKLNSFKFFFTVENLWYSNYPLFPVDNHNWTIIIGSHLRILSTMLYNISEKFHAFQNSPTIPPVHYKWDLKFKTEIQYFISNTNLHFRFNRFFPNMKTLWTH